MQVQEAAAGGHAKDFSGQIILLVEGTKNCCICSHCKSFETQPLYLLPGRDGLIQAICYLQILVDFSKVFGEVHLWWPMQYHFLPRCAA